MRGFLLTVRYVICIQELFGFVIQTFRRRGLSSEVGNQGWRDEVGAEKDKLVFAKIAKHFRALVNRACPLNPKNACSGLVSASIWSREFGVV